MANFRRAIGLSLCALIATGQAFALLLALIDLRGPPWLWTALVVGAIPIAVTVGLWRTRALRRAADPRMAWWVLAAPVVFGLWAAGYFAIGELRPESVAQELEDPLLRRLPVWPWTVFIYLGVHPLFWLPFAVSPTPEDLRRHIVAVAAVAVVSFIVWWVFPVTLPREPLADEGYATWALEFVRGADPPVNCLPSTHCAMALLAALTISWHRRALVLWLVPTAFAIGASTLLTRQHYGVDVISGYALGALAFVVTRRIS